MKPYPETKELASQVKEPALARSYGDPSEDLLGQLQRERDVRELREKILAGMRSPTVPYDASFFGSVREEMDRLLKK